MAIINNSELEKAMVKVENILEDYNQQDVDLILQFVRIRRMKKVQDQRVSDTVNSNPMMKFARKMMKGDK